LRLRRGGSRVTDSACRYEKDEDKDESLDMFLVEIMNSKSVHGALDHTASLQISNLMVHRMSFDRYRLCSFKAPDGDKLTVRSR